MLQDLLPSPVTRTASRCERAGPQLGTRGRSQQQPCRTARHRSESPGASEPLSFEQVVLEPVDSAGTKAPHVRIGSLKNPELGSP